MAKFDLKFLANDCDDYALKVEKHYNEIIVTTLTPDHNIIICLDISTAIKFAKTLRTEINKAKEVNDG